MELDKRIKTITDILTVVNSDLKGIIGKTGYFGNSIMDFKRLDTCEYGELTGIIRNTDRCFEYENCADSGRQGYCYFIPEDYLLPEEKPEKKYRPYSLNEFLERYKIGNTVTFRIKKGEHVPEEECRVEYTRLITGYETLPENRDIPGKSSILLGGCPPTSLARLFEFYELENEYYFPTVWQPFGVIEDD